ncbi:SH3 domain-containing protein 19 [Condylostylus longicornis]|uniref:SH3 domain-containing protein 19 n=1 Tax=Condylostylus longicornis TaxID=2530218 RepID=UPI00244DD7BB|nr:SH3 domain-containing protein 19 [Condylostylus longicornis]XP_055387665.1 SH3 domain-containing protein 19 [Condylostylus longicornis]XP_055387666.1 SH3 domain-containing protein 19 [Condylostylus longicornis]
MTIPTRPAPPPPQTISQQHQQQNISVNQNHNLAKITITLPPPPSAKNKDRQPDSLLNSVTQCYTSSSGITARENNNSKTKSITRNFPQAKTRYAPSTSWNGVPFDSSISTTNTNNRKTPPPRPPPPKLANSNENKFGSSNGLPKTSRPPQSVNVLSNLFGRRKSPSILGSSQKYPTSKGSQITNLQVSNHNHYNNALGSANNLFPDWSSNQQTFSPTLNKSPNNIDSNDVQLISFDSPPNSPTFTQKSNSDCVSVDSFSSDSNFSSPHNGNASQPESGFEDDFSTANASANSTQLTSPVDPWDIINESKNVNNINNTNFNYMHLNNMKNIDAHPIRNLHILQRKNNENNVAGAVHEKNVISSQPKFGMPTIIRPKLQKGAAPKPPGVIVNHNHMSKFISNFDNPQNLDDLQDSFEDNDPPMPTGPPPPPPSNLINSDFENAEINFDSKYDNLEIDNSHEIPYGIAMYDFNSEEVGDLNFKENDKIYLLSRLNEEWFMGKNKKGCEGIFPCNYVDVKIPLKEEKCEKLDNQKKSQFANSTSNIVKVLYTFEASYPEDLTILENQMVKILYRINEDWLFGEINNKQGQFPANFVEKIPDNLMCKMP